MNKNGTYLESISGFNSNSLQRVGGSPSNKRSGRTEEIGVQLNEDGSRRVRYLAPGASSIEMSYGGPGQTKTVSLTNLGDSLFETTLPYEEAFRGIWRADFKVDGVSAINPYMPVMYSGGRIANYIDFPDPETREILLNDVPHGRVTREYFYSETTECYLSCLVYTPPMYPSDGPYPVLYLQHGAGENETSWVEVGKIHFILDNLIAEGKAKPFVVVMNNGMIKMDYEKEHINGFDAVEGVITKDCRSFIEQHYNVSTDKHNRAIAGLSLGSMQASQIGFSHSDLYEYIGLFSGFMRRRDEYPTFEENPYLNSLKEPGWASKNYRLLFRSGGDREWNCREFDEDDEFCKNHGVDQMPGYIKKTYSGWGHNWNCWRRAFIDFAQLVFQDK